MDVAVTVQYMIKLEYRYIEANLLPAVLADIWTPEDALPLICLLDTGMTGNLLPARILKYFGVTLFDLPEVIRETPGGNFPARGPFILSLSIDSHKITDLRVYFSDRINNFGVLGRDTLDAGLRWGMEGAPHYSIYLGW